MSGSFLSPLWYRVAGLRPALKAQARIRRQRFRGRVWYVVQDPASGRFSRFTPATRQLLGLLDGQRTMEEVWQCALQQMGDDVPSQEQVIALLSQLHAADLLLCGSSPDVTELFDRFHRQQRAKTVFNLRNPLSIRIPLWDPDRFLSRALPVLAPVLGWGGALAWIVAVGCALALAGVHWPELTSNLSDRVLGADNLLLLAVCYAAVKALHELGHGVLTKAGGGEVHEMGLLFLVLMPVPYVDASAASGFRRKWRRVLVGAGGMLTELFIASIFMVVWVLAEPGLLRAVAFDIVLVTGISTVVFNANPLLRFDGYFILADLLEIPNLAARSNRHWRDLVERYVFRMPNLEHAGATPGERRWFLFYAPAALLYRLIVTLTIIVVIASKWFFIGVVLAVWAALTMLVVPLARLPGYFGALPGTSRVRRRAVVTSSLALAAASVLLTVVPAPFRIQTEGVLWLPDEAQVRAESSGFVQAVLARPGDLVRAGTPLIDSVDPLLAAQVSVSEARVAELQARLDQELFSDRVQAELTRQALATELANHRRLTERSERLVARSRVDGVLMLDRQQDLPGRYFRQGELYGYVVHDARRIVRMVVAQEDIDLVRNRLARIDVRLAERGDTVYRASILREVPAADVNLPSPALSSEGGGRLATDPRQPKSGKALATTFQFDVVLPEGVQAANYGGRAYVRLALEPEPLARQAYRRVRQLFLSQFNV